MRKIITLIFVKKINAQYINHILDIIIKYQVSLVDLERKIETFNIDTLKKKNNLKILILTTQNYKIKSSI